MEINYIYITDDEIIDFFIKHGYKVKVASIKKIEKIHGSHEVEFFERVLSIIHNCKTYPAEEIYRKFVHKRLKSLLLPTIADTQKEIHEIINQFKS